MNVAQQVQLFLEDCVTPMRAQVIADRFALKAETVYEALVGLYDQGLVRIAREPVTGRVAGWESA